MDAKNGWKMSRCGVPISGIVEHGSGMYSMRPRRAYFRFGRRQENGWRNGRFTRQLALEIEFASNHRPADRIAEPQRDRQAYKESRPKVAVRIAKGKDMSEDPTKKGQY